MSSTQHAEQGVCVCEVGVGVVSSKVQFADSFSVSEFC